MMIARCHYSTFSKFTLRLLDYYKTFLDVVQDDFGAENSPSVAAEFLTRNRRIGPAGSADCIEHFFDDEFIFGQRISTASGSERGSRKGLAPEVSLATARGTDSPAES
jgi:hypothetical protein